jgi:hypothetical protein
MKKIQAWILAALLFAAVPAGAQKRNTTVKGKAVATMKTKNNNNAGRQLFNTLLPATAKVMFIDSMVVAKNDFLSHIPLNAESGKLSVKNRKGKDFLAQYETELGDRRFYALGDTASTALYMQTKVGNDWGQQSCLADISDEDYHWQNYPFLCADGVTLFFSATGPNSVGGRDIFMTSYDSDKDEWLQPQNYGLPFNSTANDYLLAIDDLDTLGWLVSDRHQHADSVCIYTFVPTQVRKNFAADNLSTAQLEHYAQIHRIADTWAFGDRKAALRRRDAMMARANVAKTHATTSFILNDNTLVTDEKQLKSTVARNLFRQWVELGNMIDDTRRSLEHNRELYARGQRTLAQDILSKEKDLKQQLTDLHNVAKKLRQAELQK